MIISTKNSSPSISNILLKKEKTLKIKRKKESPKQALVIVITQFTPSQGSVPITAKDTKTVLMY